MFFKMKKYVHFLIPCFKSVKALYAKCAKWNHQFAYKGAFMIVNVGSLICGFRVDSVTEAPDVGGRMWRMTYEKNGAELIWLEREDDVKTFSIAFKTLPEDDTGVAHILEHSVLAGSEKYPVKSPFDEMCKSSVRVFMNAMTSRDVTYYPFSTRNDVDYLNLTDVYLDAVFNPLVTKTPLAFQQEGWHYEWNKETRELSVNGVVYNEMKGVFALAENRVSREIISALYPENVYGNDSGGRPEKILDLTYEQFCAFHKRFYHPSNARIFLDGRVPLKEVLTKLEAYLSRFDAKDMDVAIPLQRPIEVNLRLPYSSATSENKVFFVEGWSVGCAEDPVYCYALDILTDYLCGTNESPLKKALLEQKLCRDVSMSAINYQEIPLYILLKDTSEEKLETCRKVIRETLTTLCERGFDKAQLHALINRDEFANRELNTRHPKGFVYFSRILRPWLYGGDPVTSMTLSDNYAKLREGVQHGLFESLVRDKILGNRHHAEVILFPDAELEARTVSAHRKRLETIRDAMSEADLDNLEADIAKLKAYQHRKDSIEAIEKIPRLKSSELSPSATPLSSDVQYKDGTVQIKTKSTADGIFYLTLYFPMDDFSAEELLKMPLFAHLHGKLKTSKQTVLELQTKIAATVGQLSFSTVSAARGRYFKVSIASLLENQKSTFDLLKEVLLTTNFEDQAEVEAILRQKQRFAERDVLNDGRAITLYCAKRNVEERWAVADLLHGEQQLRWLQQTTVDESLQRWYATLSKRLFCQNGMVISFTDNLPEECVEELLTAFPTMPKERVEIVSSKSNVQGFLIDGDTSFSAWALPLPKGVVATGAMRVAAKILSREYLHNEVREIGGAYGVTMRVTPSGFVECFSYRDPNPLRSLQKMNEVGAALRRFATSDVDIDRYIVATIAEMDPYRSPADEAARAVSLFVEHRTEADQERVRREILATTKEQLLAFATLLEDLKGQASTSIVGGQRQLQDLTSDQVQPIIQP